MLLHISHFSVCNANLVSQHTTCSQLIPAEEGWDCNSNQGLWSNHDTLLTFLNLVLADAEHNTCHLGCYIE